MKPKPTHYKVVCVSMYNADLEVIDQAIAELRARGWTSMNRSKLLRLAVSKLDVAGVEIPEVT